MARIEIRLPDPYVKEKNQVFPDLAACIAALPLVEFVNSPEQLANRGGEIVDELWCVGTGEAHGRVYHVEDVLRTLGLRPEWRCFFGLGNVDPEHGWNWMPGRHLLGMQK